MRRLNAFEERNVTLLVQNNIDFTMVQSTATGLKKRILDATAPMRAFLLEKGVHDYAAQGQGELHKCLRRAVIYDEATAKDTQISLYRPLTKKGDPRLWIYGLNCFANDEDIHAIFVFDGAIRVFNLTRVDLHRVCESVLATPLQDILKAYSAARNSVSDELLSRFRQWSGQWFESEVTADTGIGRTIETMLGIAQNANKTPDYKGIELKSHREKRSSTKNVLFTQAPDWPLSRLKSGREIVAKYGYDCGDGRLTYQNTVRCGAANTQGLWLNLNLLAELLELQHCGTTTDDVAVWTLLKLHDRLAEKHHETFWIAVENEMHDGKEYFRYTTIEHTRNPIIPQFDVLLESGQITVDLLLCRPSGHGDTYSFKITRHGMSQLFPESVTYKIL